MCILNIIAIPHTRCVIRRRRHTSRYGCSTDRSSESIRYDPTDVTLTRIIHIRTHRACTQRVRTSFGCTAHSSIPSLVAVDRRRRSSLAAPPFNRLDSNDVALPTQSSRIIRRTYCAESTNRLPRSAVQNSPPRWCDDGESDGTNGRYPPNAR